MTGFQGVAAATVASAFAFGMVLALIGSIKLPLAKRLNLGEERVAGLLAALNLALIPMMLVSGVLIDQLGVKGVLVVGSVVTAGALFLLATITDYVGALGALLLVGAGGACVSTAGSVLMPRAFFPHNPTASQNLGNVFFGLGALVTPTLADFLIRRLDFRRALGLLALIGLLPAVAAALTVREAFPVPGEVAGLGVVLSDPILWMIGLAFWLYGPLEGSIGTWATTYLTELHYRERLAALLLSGFWLVFLASRLTTALVQGEGIMATHSEPWFLAILALASAVFLGNMVGSTTPTSGALGLLLVGAFFGPIFPTLVGILFERFEEGQRGTAYGAMFAIGATGSLVVPPLIGRYARRNGVRKAMRIPMVIALVLSLMTLTLGLMLPLFRRG